MRVLLCVAVLIATGLAGCAEADDPPAVVDDGPQVHHGADGCPLTYPDGTPFDCAGFWTEPTSSTRPSLDDGWRCRSTWGEENVHTEEWVHHDGRIGFYWEWQRWKPDGFAMQRLGIYTSQTEGVSIHVPYHEQGFVAVATDIADDQIVDVHNTLRQIRIWAQDDAGEWFHPDDAVLVPGHFGGDTWLVVRFDWPGGPWYVDLNVPDPEDDEYSQWGSPSFHGTVNGVPVIIGNQGNGIKYNQGAFQSHRLATPSCNVALPVAA